LVFPFVIVIRHTHSPPSLYVLLQLIPDAFCCISFSCHVHSYFPLHRHCYFLSVSPSGFTRAHVRCLLLYLYQDPKWAKFTIWRAGLDWRKIPFFITSIVISGEPLTLNPFFIAVAQPILPLLTLTAHFRCLALSCFSILYISIYLSIHLPIHVYIHIYLYIHILFTSSFSRSRALSNAALRKRSRSGWTRKVYIYTYIYI